MDFSILRFEARRLGMDCLWQSVRFGSVACFRQLANGLVSAEQAQYLLSMILCWAMLFADGRRLPSADAAMMIFCHS
jgi:hypothetical protein